MNDDSKKSITGALMAKQGSDDRKPLPAAVAAAPTPTKKVFIKSADMMINMQKEAIDIAVNVRSFSFFLTFAF